MPIKTLLVEDSPADARIVQELVRQTAGRQIVLRYADRVSTALESINAEHPDALLLDLSLPDSKGLATFRRIHAKAAAVPIIVLTGLDDLDVAVESIAEGASDYLLKSDLSGGLLVRVLRYSLERKRIEEALRRTERELTFQNRIAKVFLTAREADLSAGVVGAILAFMQSERAVFGYIDPNGALVCPALPSSGDLSAKILGAGGTLPRETWNGVWGQVLNARQAILSNERSRELDVLVRRALAVPLLDRGELVGLFEVADKPVDYEAEDCEFLERAAAYLAPILHARLQRDAHERAISAALAAKEVLLQEVHHRVKNNLQIISSLLNMYADGLPDQAQQALDESQRRVRSMALVHEQLYSRDRPDELDFAEYATSLASEILTAFSVDSGAIRLRFELEPVLLSIDQAVPCALILNELITNAVKYAFPDHRGGEILVTLNDCGENRIRLRVADDGIGFPPGFDRTECRSLGLRIVDILTYQLNGTIEFGPGPGADFQLTFVRQIAHPPLAERAM
jgi:two-component sensor histidine kinase/DNA-binding response OmpR family regulator